jgi:hypothetical protein
MQAPSGVRCTAVVLAVLGLAQAPAHAQAPAAPPAARTAAPIDLTGYWVAVISEDWRWRMLTPARGDFPSIPLNLAAQKIAESWDPAKDEAAGEQCRAYGAPGLMRGPTRLRIAWQDDNTLRLDTDYGTQTRLFRFASARGSDDSAKPGWQGVSTAQWIGSGGRGEGGGGRRGGSMKTITTQLRPGYLRKNGVPYSAKTVFTEYWDVHAQANGDRLLVVTNIVDDPVYLQAPWITAIHFKKEMDGSKWDPTPCDARL